MSHIVGIMWAKNEVDVIRETIEDALKHVDTMMIADDGSMDGTWRTIREMQRKYPAQIEHIQQAPNRFDKGQREALLKEIKRRYLPFDTWVQVIEADIFLQDTDVRAICAAETKLAITWQCLNAVRRPDTWAAVDTYPKWKQPIREIMPLAHRLEVMLYTYRPLPDVHYDSAHWRPWPRGWANYVNTPLKVDRKVSDAPLLVHVGYRGPTHFYEKYKGMGPRHPRYTTWDLTSPERIEKTVPFFNGQWNNRVIFPATREGWKEWVKKPKWK